ncbi:neuronal calcium sensor 2-like [Ruditapes philippinarum]|uniref:neuronal calcium sensor 2-like n=1 Tax=Ruditapes philippinarum TaxID=129788 RepID=UPI00295B25C0|nr:neuronal calcium sensor 2-like [Ruditapes philippinarum]
MGGNQAKGLSKRELCKLQKQVNMPVEEIQQWHRDFKKNAKNGRYLKREQFREVYTDMFGSGALDFADNVFRTFDRDGNGCVDFEEFILGIYMSSSNDIDLKLKWAFNMYDMDGNGSIDKHELFSIINCSFNMHGEENGENPEELTESLFREMDTDGNGEISWEEFYTTACKDKRVLQLLHM